ncbi:hypothetical protein [Streptomyces sp. NPDC005573]
MASVTGTSNSPAHSADRRQANVHADFAEAYAAENENGLVNA